MLDRLRNIFKKRYSLVDTGFWGMFFEPRQPFSNVIFTNIVEILTDLVNDVTLTLRSGDRMMFSAFKAFIEYDGQFALNYLFRFGYIPISYDPLKGFRILDMNEYTVQAYGEYNRVVPRNSELSVYVVQSDIFKAKGISDMAYLRPFLDYLDNVLNSSNTLTARLGAFIAACPKSENNISTILSKKELDALEKDIMNNYGSKREQKQFMVFNRPMDFSVLNLSGIDAKTNDKVRLAILAICDRVKVPANQVAIIDANSSKTLANGSELREGDFNKYQSFERLLNKTFIRMAFDLGMQVDYTIYNKPTRQLTTTTI